MASNAKKLLLIFAKNGEQFTRLNHPGLPITDCSPILLAGLENFVVDPLLLLQVSRDIEDKAEYGGYVFHMSFPDRDGVYQYVILQKEDSDVSISETKSAFDHLALGDNSHANIDTAECGSIDSPDLENPVKNEAHDEDWGWGPRASRDSHTHETDGHYEGEWPDHAHPLSSPKVEHTHAHPNPLVNPKRSGGPSKHKYETSRQMEPRTKAVGSWSSPASESGSWCFPASERDPCMSPVHTKSGCNDGMTTTHHENDPENDDWRVGDYEDDHGRPQAPIQVYLPPARRKGFNVNAAPRDSW